MESKVINIRNLKKTEIQYLEYGKRQVMCFQDFFNIKDQI